MTYSLGLDALNNPVRKSAKYYYPHFPQEDVQAQIG